MTERMESLRLPTTSYIILGVLTWREVSGYEIKFVLDRSVRYIYASPAQSQIYAELRRLESNGLVTMTRVAQEHRPDKRVYRITPKGREFVENWLEDSKIEPDTYKSAFQLRLFFGNLLSYERLVSIVGNQRRWLVEGIMILEDKLQELETRVNGGEKELFFPLLTADLRLATFRAELDWADRTLERLKEWRETV